LITVDKSLEFRPMISCPINSKVLLLNKAGIATTGWWDGKDTWFIGWFPLPSVPAEIKRSIIQQSNIGALLGD
jgi:hypothetical protein